MTKQGKIQKRIKFHLKAVYESGLRRSECDIGFVVDIIVSELHSQGVVIKVDRELPRPKHVTDETWGWMNDFLIRIREKFIKAGYEAVEPLIEE